MLKPEDDRTLPAQTSLLTANENQVTSWKGLHLSAPWSPSSGPGRPSQEWLELYSEWSCKLLPFKLCTPREEIRRKGLLRLCRWGLVTGYIRNVFLSLPLALNYSSDSRGLGKWMNTVFPNTFDTVFPWGWSGESCHQSWCAMRNIFTQTLMSRPLFGVLTLRPVRIRKSSTRENKLISSVLFPRETNIKMQAATSVAKEENSTEDKYSKESVTSSSNLPLSFGNDFSKQIVVPPKFLTIGFLEEKKGMKSYTSW